MFRVYTDPSPCPRLLPWTSVSDLVATCSDFLGHGRPSSSEVVQCACSKPPVYVVATAGYQKWPLPRVTSDPSLGCSVNTILSGSRTLNRTRILGQCKCKGAFTLHPRSRSEHPSPSLDAIETTELMFQVYTDPSPCPKLLPRMSVSELIAM